jgi:hypothetical protein
MKKSELRQLIREEISQLREAVSIRPDSSGSVTVTNKKTGNTYEVSKSHYEANSDKYEVAGDKGKGGFGVPAKQVPVKGKLGKGMPATADRGNEKSGDGEEFDLGKSIKDLRAMETVKGDDKVGANDSTPLSKGETEAMWELNNFLDSTESLQKQMLTIQKGLGGEMKRGNYDPDTAWKPWLRWVNAGAEKYSKEHSTGEDSSEIFPDKVRIALAKELAGEWQEDHAHFDDDNYGDFDDDDF